jgi:DNA adenine methylase
VSAQNRPKARRAKMPEVLMRFHGGKGRLAAWVASHFPPHGIYVEPFAGMASVFFHKAPCRLEILNDLDGDLVNFFRVIQSPPTRDDLLALLALTPYSREEITHTFAEPRTDPVGRAADFCIRVSMSFNHVNREGCGFATRLNNNRCTDLEKWVKLPERILETAGRLKGVILENYPATKVIARYDDPDCLIYCDPPYHIGAKERFVHEQNHSVLAEMLHNTKSMVVLSGVESDLYERYYSNWHKVTKNSMNMKSGHVTDCLWMSPTAYEKWRDYGNSDCGQTQRDPVGANRPGQGYWVD